MGVPTSESRRTPRRVTAPRRIHATFDMELSRHADPLDWHAEVAYAYDSICRELAGTPLLANMTLEVFTDFCRRHTPGCEAMR